MKKTINAKILAFVLTLAMILSVVGTVFAEPAYLVDDTKKGSLTLNKQEKVSGSETATPLEGVTFTIYLVDETVETAEAAETYISTNNVTGTSLTTGEDGIVKFENLALGRYYVKETAYPANVIAPIEAFLVDIPMTNDTETEWVYDVVASPKNQTVYGDVNLIKTNAGGTPLAGVVFKLQKSTGTDTWADYAIGNSAEFTTDSDGTITVENLPAGTYRFVEVSTLDGYILDKSVSYDFTVAQDQTEAIVLNATNEKSEVEKQVKLADGTYGDSAAVFETDTIDWKISVNVPTIIGKLDVFQIVDNFGSNINIDESSVVITGVNGDVRTEITSGVTAQKNDTSRFWGFTPSSLVDENNKPLYDTIEISYKATLKDLDNVYGTDITNEALVRYRTVIDEDGTPSDETSDVATDTDTASVFTGKLLVYKTNGTNALAGAQFKIATTEDNAKDGVYVKDAEENDIVATSDSNGYVVFEGLEYGQDGQEAATADATSYWIVEIQAPDGYNLLKKPVEVKVNATSGNYVQGTTTEIVNKTGFELPATGAVGAILFTVAGLAIMATVVVLLKKSNKEEK